jgi:steroid Delta-isomerase
MIDCDAITWNAPDSDHPARRAGQLSNATVARGAKDEWLALFAPDAVIEDPVGPSFLDPEGKGHQGRDEISKFWDANVSRIKKFHFDISDSFANGPTCANVVTITTTLDDAGTTMRIECILIYTVDDQGLIKSLRAHWEPDRAMATVGAPS